MAQCSRAAALALSPKHAGLEREGAETGVRKRNDQARRRQLRPAQRRQARSHGDPAARLRRRRQRFDRAGAGHGPADARRGLLCAQRTATLRGQSLRLPVVPRVTPRSDAGAGRRARRGGRRRCLPRREDGRARPGREQDGAGRLLAGHDDGPACRPAPRQAACRHRRLLGHAGGAGSPEGQDQVAAAGAADPWRQGRDAAAYPEPSRRRGAAAARREGRPAHRRRHRPRHQRHGAVGRRALPDRVVQAADAANDRRHLQARLRARRRSLPEELRRQGRGRRLGVPRPSAARPWSTCGAARPTRRLARRGRRTRSASSSPAPRAQRRSDQGGGEGPPRRQQPARCARRPAARRGSRPRRGRRPRP